MIQINISSLHIKILFYDQLLNLASSFIRVEIKQNTKINMAIDIVLALDYMHLSDIVHRDIKS